MKDNKALKRLLRSADTQTELPDGVKERIFINVISAEFCPDLRLSTLERFFFVKPLRAAFAVAAPLTISLWAVTGGNFIGFLNGFIH